MLSNITIYDGLIAITKRGYETATRNLRTEQNRLSKNKGKSRTLNKQLKTIRDKIEVKTDSIEDSRGNLEIAKNKIEELIGKIEDAETKTALKKKKEFLENELQRNDDALSKKYNGLHKKMFTDYWVLKHSQKYFDTYSQAYKKYFAAHNRVANIADTPTIKLPINIPQPIHVNRMLEDQKCFVCNRDAKKGTAEYEFIESLLLRDEPIDPRNTFQNDCSAVFSKLYDNGLSFKQLLTNIDRKIATEFSEIQNFQNAISSSRSDIEELKGEFEELIEDDKSEDIVKAFRTHEANREKYQSILNADEKILENAVKVAKEIEADLDKLVVGKLNEFTEKSNAILGDLYEITKSTRDEVFSKIIVELEDQANTLFDKMTERNHAITGKIKLKRLSSGKYIPEIIGSDGHILGNPNDSNLVLVKLSLIMAILISRAKWSENYSLILDAPTSKMAEKYTHGFYETIGQNFAQSIVTTYDFINEDQRALLKEFNLGNIYTVESHFPNGDSSDRADLEVIVNKVQL